MRVIRKNCQPYGMSVLLLSALHMPILANASTSLGNLHFLESYPLTTTGGQRLEHPTEIRPARKDLRKSHISSELSPNASTTSISALTSLFGSRKKAANTAAIRDPFPTAAQREWLYELGYETDLDLHMAPVAQRTPATLDSLRRMSMETFRQLIAASETFTIATLVDIDHLAVSAWQDMLIAAAVLDRDRTWHGPSSSRSRASHSSRITQSRHLQASQRGSDAQKVYRRKLAEFKTLRKYLQVIEEQLLKRKGEATVARESAQRELQRLNHILLVYVSVRSGEASRHARRVLEDTTTQERNLRRLCTYVKALMSMLSWPPHSREYQARYGSDFVEQLNAFEQGGYSSATTMSDDGHTHDKHSGSVSDPEISSSNSD